MPAPRPARAEGVAILAITTLKKRPEFLAVRNGARASCSACLIEARVRAGNSATSAPRFGFTVTKKLGNAVARNRIRRRLKAAVSAAHSHARPDYDYVLVARPAAFDRPFADLVADVGRALQALHRPRAPRDEARDRSSPNPRKKGAP